MGQVGEMAHAAGRARPTCTTAADATASINFVTCHDGFTLADLVSYNDKHNEANGEDNRDGANDNNSLELRRRRADRRSGDQRAAPAADQERRWRCCWSARACRCSSWATSSAARSTATTTPTATTASSTGSTGRCRKRTRSCSDFCRRMVAFRLAHSALRNCSFAGQPQTDGGMFEISIHGVRAWQPDWSTQSRVLAMMAHRASAGGHDIVYAAFNMFWEPLEFELPAPASGQWRRFADTGARASEDACEPGQEPVLENQGSILVGPRSTVILTARA